MGSLKVHITHQTQSHALNINMWILFVARDQMTWCYIEGKRSESSYSSEEIYIKTTDWLCGFSSISSRYINTIELNKPTNPKTFQKV